MKNKSDNEKLVGQVEFYRFYLILVLVFIVIFFSVEAYLPDNVTHNQKVLYCQISNNNAVIANEMIPYFEWYMDTSIAAVNEVNQTLGRLLELQLASSRGITLPTLDCPVEECDGPFSEVEDEEVCNLIIQIKNNFEEQSQLNNGGQK